MTSNSSLVLLIVVTIFTASIIYCESKKKNSHQKNDIVKLVRDVSVRMWLCKNDNKFADQKIDSLINVLEFSSGQKLNQLLAEILKDNGSDINLKCVADLFYVYENLMPIGGWASKMIDSYGKPESGIFQGNLRWLGDFNECLSVYAPLKSRESNFPVGDFHGQYCTLQLTAHLGNTSVPISIGTCLPDSCHPSNEKKVLNQSFIPPIATTFLSDVTLNCQPKFEKFTTAAICVMFLISIFMLLALTGSLITAYEKISKIETNRHFITTSGYDNRKSTPTLNGVDISRKSFLGDDDAPILGYRRPVKELPAWLERWKPFFNCFCVFTNGAKLLDTSNSEGQLPCLHGIRFLSLSWVILFHTYSYSVNYIRNGDLAMMDHWWFQIVLNGDHSVDSFFLLSGFLRAYLFFEVASKNNGWLHFYVHRYVRLTPVYMIILGFYAAVFPYMGSGPLWTTDEIDPNCAKNWWKNLLYINSFADVEEMCVPWTWYLSNDMQFFVISPLFLIALSRCPSVGYTILAVFLNATTWIIFFITYQNDLVTGFVYILEAEEPQALIRVSHRILDFFNKLYTKPYARYGPYIVGVSLAFYLYKRRQNNCGKNSLITLSCGWFIASTIMLACIFGLYHRHMSILEISFYNAVNRTCFAGGLAWVIYVCLTGQGGFVNSFLSSKLFIPLSRITYCAYLVNPIVMLLYYSSLKSGVVSSHPTYVILFMGFLVMSYGVGLITSLLFELPVMKLDKLVSQLTSYKLVRSKPSTE